jgi:nucleotide-binding universal stress UspA family protein
MPADAQILVPLDGSDTAARALPYAAAVARALGAPVMLLAVWQPIAPHALRFHGAPPAADLDRETAATAAAYLEQTRSVMEAAVPVTTLVRRGDAADEIVSAARAINAKMIVMSTHGRSGISRWRLGSVAGRVLRESETPLLAIGPTVASRELAPVELGRIMIALDGSAFGEAALPIAQELAAALGAHVTLARSIASAFIQYPFAPIALTLPAVDDQLAAEASVYLESKAASFPGADLAVLHGSDAATQLCDAIDERQIDLVVMATHARATVGRAVLGSTADRLLQCNAPVLLVRPG